MSSVFISPIPARLTEASLREHLTKFGKLVSLTLPLRKSGSCRGYATATFESEAAAEAAIASDEKPENAKIKIERLEMAPRQRSHKPVPVCTALGSSTICDPWERNPAPPRFSFFSYDPVPAFDYDFEPGFCSLF